MNKITVVGAGHVGATTAQRLAEKELAREVVLVDILEGIPQGKGLDQWQSGPVEGFDTRIVGTNDYAAAAGSDLFVVTAGLPRKPGMSRDDLVKTNAEIVKAVGLEIKKVAPKAFVIVVSNPLDVMCYVAKQVDRLPARAGHRHGGDPRHRAVPHVPVGGDRRLRRGHPGDGARRPRRLDGAADLLHDGLRHPDHAVHRPGTSSTRSSSAPARAAGEIVAHLKTGSAYYAPSSGAVQMVEAIVKDKKRLLPCAAWLTGEFGLKDVYLGVPCMLGAGGAEKIVEVELTTDEKAALEKSADEVRATMEVVKF